MLINVHLSIKVPGDMVTKPTGGNEKNCLSEMRNNVYVAKVTKLSHKKCMI